MIRSKMGTRSREPQEDSRNRIRIFKDPGRHIAITFPPIMFLQSAVWGPHVRAFRMASSKSENGLKVETTLNPLNLKPKYGEQSSIPNYPPYTAAKLHTRKTITLLFSVSVTFFRSLLTRAK